MKGKEKTTEQHESQAEKTKKKETTKWRMIELKHVFNRIISVVVALCLMLSITALAAGAPAAEISGNETQSTNSVNEETTGKVMMLKLNNTWAYLNGGMIPTLVYDSGYVSKLIMINGSTFLPLRFVCQCLGLEVGYNEQTSNSTITDTEHGARYELVTGTTEMYKYDLDGNLLATGTATAPTTIIEGVTHVPVRSLLEAMGFHVYWDDGGYVLISEDPMTAEEFSGLIELWDADGDGLSDIFETDILHTNPNNSDTDGDGLPDGYEVNTLGTDPLKQDTDDNGTLDGAEDFDEDGLTNLQEFTLKTDPFEPDTDEDGLTDGEEVNTAHTDPLNPDTDGDSISDGDEITMGLDPLNQQTFGVPDSQYIFTQRINDKKLRKIFTGHPYYLDIDITAAGNANNALTINEGPDINSFSFNDAIVGNAVELSYDENLKVDSITLEFQIPDDEISTPTGRYNTPGLEGDKRFQIFKYDRGSDLLFPVQTEYHSFTFSTTTQELGCYMIIDLDKWMYTLGIAPEEGETPNPVTSYNIPETVQPEPIQPETVGSEVVQPDEITDDVSSYKFEELPEHHDEIMQKQLDAILNVNNEESLNNIPGLNKYNKQIDLVFAIDLSGSMEDILPIFKTKISQISSTLYTYGITANIGIITYGDYRYKNVTHTIGNTMWAKTSWELNQILHRIVVNKPILGIGGYGDENHLDAMETVMQMPFRNNVPKIAVLMTDEPIILENNNCYRNNGKTTDDIADELNEMNIVTYVVSSAPSFDALSEKTGGEIIPYIDFENALLPSIMQSFDRTYTYIGANDLCVRVLHTPITKNGPTDSDGDSLTDWQETDRDALAYFAKTPYNDGDVITDLPTFTQYMYYSNFYVSSPFSRLSQHYSDELSELLVLPIVSDPLMKDSDSDGYPDSIDIHKLTPDAMYINDRGIDDSDFHNGSTITEKNSPAFTDGKFSANQSNGTAKYVFNRSAYKYHLFSLTPEKSAFYRFSGTSDLKITYEKGLLFKKTVTVNPETDGTFALDQGTKYTIKMKTSSGEFSVEQDNWVYAPNGGKWTPTKYSNLNAWSNYMREGSLYIPTSRFISAVSKLNDDMVTLDLDPNGDIDKQLDKLFTNTGMLVEQDEIDSARNAILAVAGTTTVSIILIVFPEPSSTAVGTKKLAHTVVQIITALSDVATYSGTPSAISTFMAYAEQYGFTRAFKEGDRNVYTSKTSFGRSWNPWTSAPYINKFCLGDRGIVDKNITDQNIIDWCGWKVLEAAK